MQQTIIADFIIFDDDPINNLICEKMIRMTIPGCVVKTFTEPEKGLGYLLENYAAVNDKDAVLLLDINMPVLNGWDVLDRFSEFPAILKGHVRIFMLSSSVDPVDTEKAELNPYVSGYIMKALSQAKLQSYFPGYING